MEGSRQARGVFFRISVVLWATIFAAGLMAAVHTLFALSGQVSTEDRLKAPNWWPTKGNYARSEYAGPEACAGCHIAQAETWKTTSMARAGFESRESEIFQHFRKLEFRQDPFTYRLEKTGETITYTVTDGVKVFTQPLQWVMGLGTVGQTFVYEREGTYFESRVSYLSSVGRLGITPGETRALPTAALADAAGSILDRAGAERCFACHITAAVVKNRLRPDGMIAGVTCEACHGPGVRHIAAVQAGESVKGTIFNPNGLRASESVDFCGACHLTRSDVMQVNIRGILNVRFQPYRLMGSRCWNPDDARINCVACHDPHQPLEKRAAAYDEKCLACHVARRTDAVSKEHPGRACPVGTQDWSTCHMPKIEIKDMFAHFSDHRIRVVRPDETYPD